MSNLRDMGIKRKEMYPAEVAKPSKDQENEKSYPTLHLSGPQAKLFGADGLKVGDRVSQTVEWVVKHHSQTKTDGKEPDITIELCLDKCTEPEVVDAETPSDATESDEPDSPALAYIAKNAAQ